MVNSEGVDRGELWGRQESRGVVIINPDLSLDLKYMPTTHNRFQIGSWWIRGR